MMPRLKAEEAIAGANTAALGAGTMAPGDARRFQEQLQQAAGVKRAATTDPRLLAVAGIKVVRREK